MSARMAFCHCGAPLICTLLFSGAEFYCLECGSLYGWFGPNAKNATPRREARLAGLRAEWDEHVSGKMLGGGVMLRECETCSRVGEPHLQHATDDERSAHHAALKWLEERAA